MFRNSRFLFSIIGSVASLGVSYPTPAQDRDSPNALTDERTLTRDYLRFRFRSGTAQPEWIETLNKEVTELKSGEKGEAHPGPLGARFAAAWGAGSEKQLKEWVKENYTLLWELWKLPAPAGPLPLPDHYSISGRVPSGLPDGWTLLRMMRLLVAEAVMAEDNSDRKNCLRVMDNITRIFVAGANSHEFSTALGIEELKWVVLSYGLYDDPATYRSIVLESPDIVTRRDLAAVAREYDRRFYMCIVGDTGHGGLVDSPLAPLQLESLNQLNIDLAVRLQSLRSVKDLIDFRDKVTDPILNRIVGDELLGIRPLTSRLLYQEDYRAVTRAIARHGIDGAGEIDTTYFDVERKGESLIARKGDRSFQLWAPENGLGISFAKLAPPEDRGYSTGDENSSSGEAPKRQRRFVR